MCRRPNCYNRGQECTVDGVLRDVIYEAGDFLRVEAVEEAYLLHQDANTHRLGLRRPFLFDEAMNYFTTLDV